MPNKCPNCGSENVAEYIWGHQMIDSQLSQKLKDGTAKLGGGCMLFPCPTMHCNHCGNDFDFAATAEDLAKR